MNKFIQEFAQALNNLHKTSAPHFNTMGELLDRVTSCCQRQDNYIPDIMNNIIDNQRTSYGRTLLLTLILIPMSGTKNNQRKGKLNTLNNNYEVFGFGNIYDL